MELLFQKDGYSIYRFVDDLDRHYFVIPSGQTIKLQTRTTVTDFADLATEYTAPPGYKAALGAGLARSLKATPGSIEIVLDHERRVVLWNRWMERYASAPAADVLGRPAQVRLDGGTDGKLVMTPLNP